MQKISNINVNASVSKEDLVNQVSKEQNLKQNCHSLCWGALPAHNLHELSINNLTGVFLLVHKSNTIGILARVNVTKTKKSSEQF